MAAKRDYKAEERRRKELAAQRGYPNRYALRRAIETGKIAPLAPKRVRSPKTLRAQETRLATKRRGNRASASADYNAGASKITDEQRARDWSTMFSKHWTSEYKPEDARRFNMTKREYTTAYLNAWVAGPQRYTVVRHAGGSNPLEYWLVDLMEYETIEEYEGKYGAHE